MTDEQTSVLDTRQHRPAGDMTTPPDAGATGERSRGRRGRVVALAVATVTAATAAIVAWTTADGDQLSAERADEDVARPAVTAPATTDPAPDPAPTTPAGTTAPVAPSASETISPSAPQTQTSSLPAGWEPRTFEAITFAVPPGARMPDLMEVGGAGASSIFSWNGPSLGGDVYSHVSMWIDAVEGAPELGPEYQPLTVPGAARAHMWTGPTGTDPASITVDVHMLTADRRINLVAMVAPGPAGEQMVRDLIASVSIG